MYVCLKRSFVTERKVCICSVMESYKVNFNVMKDFEIRCINNNFGNYCFDFKKDYGCEIDVLNDSVKYICECIIKGDYKAVLQRNLNSYGFSSFAIDINNPECYIDNLCDKLVSSDAACQVKEFILLFIGVSALQEFIRCNFCGPRQNTVDQYNLISELLPSSEVSDFDVYQQLSLDGESIYPNAMNPKLLFVSHYILSNMKYAESLTQNWWLLRCIFIYQSILPERNESLHHALVSLINDVYQMDWLKEENNIYTKLMFAVESCHVFLYYGEIVCASKYLADAKNITGLEIELSGAMGRRRRDQEKLTAQLFVKLKRNHNFIGTVADKNECFPVDLHLQDDTLLDKIAFNDNSEHVLDNLCAEEQIVLLGHCCLVRKSEASDELLDEKMMSYINCLLSQPQIWPVFLKALIMRCKAERNNSRRVERAVSQMEAVVDSLRKELPSFNERSKFFYSTSFPAYWTIEKELADLLLSIGCSKSALDIYERLELWEDMVKCYILLGRSHSAEKVIRDQLEKKESPLLWCLLGDVTENQEYYFKAWELSNQKSARAQRSLGYYYYKKKEYQMSLSHFTSSLEINHLQPEVWFSVGYAATQTGNFDLAARAYQNVVSFDDDNFEAWNNLAVVCLKTKQKERAWRAFREALKHDYENWKIWENFLLVSTNIGAFEDALLAWHRIFDIRDYTKQLMKDKRNAANNHIIDDGGLLLLGMLVNAIVNDFPDISKQPSSRLKKKTLELFGRITSVIVNEPKIWEMYSSLVNLNSEDGVQVEILEKVVLYQQKAVRCHNQKEHWERNFISCKEVLLSSLKLAEVSLTYLKLLDGISKNQVQTSSRLNLQNILTRSKKFLQDFPDTEKNELNDILGSLNNTLNEILTI